MAAQLSPLQEACVRHTMEGLSNAEIARRLGNSPDTVKGALTEAYQRLGVGRCGNRRVAAAVSLYARDQGTHATALLRMGAPDG